MDTPSIIQHPDVIGTLAGFDRLLFRGSLNGLWVRGNMDILMSRLGVLLKDFRTFAPKVAERLKEGARAIASEAGRPYEYLSYAMTKANSEGKEAYARSIAARDGVTEGLVCVLATVELCRSFELKKSQRTGKLTLTPARRKCEYFYFYYIDREFGFMHVRLQSWFPFEIQVYVNGREWLARQMDAAGIGYQRQENSFQQIDDLPRAQELFEKLAHREMAPVLDVFAARVNGYLATVQGTMGQGYYWTINQAEYATDVMCRDRASLLRIYPALVHLAIHTFTAEDVLRFLGRKPHPNLKAAVETSLKGRPECCRVRHRLGRNSLKMYDKGSVLRIETTINNPGEFRVLRTPETGGSPRWMQMCKGVSNLWRYAQVSAQANTRYLDALGQAQPKGETIEELDGLCRSRQIDGKRFAKFHPISAEDCRVFAAAMAGGHVINGFRNADIQGRLYPGPASSKKESKQRTARVSRLIAKLRGHGLVRKVGISRLYRVTQKGYRLMAAALRCRHEDFPVFAQEALALLAA